MFTVALNNILKTFLLHFLCETTQTCHFVNFLVGKWYRLNVLFTIKILNENINRMHYLKKKIIWLILIFFKKKLKWLLVPIDLEKIIKLNQLVIY